MKSRVWPLFGLALAVSLPAGDLRQSRELNARGRELQEKLVKK
jgi:hypothetical protein